MTREEAVTVLKAFMKNPLFSDEHKAAFNIAIHDIKAHHDWDINNLILINKDNYEPLEQEPKTGHWIEHPEIEKRDIADAYNKGLNDAWEAAKKIALMDTETSENVTGYFGLFRIMENLTPMQAIEKIKEHEDKKDAEIKVGDGVYFQGDKYIVTFIANGGSSYTAISVDGDHILRASRDDITITGRHFPQIAEVLAELRGKECNEELLQVERSENG